MAELGENRTWPEDLFEFAWFNERDDRLRELSEIAEQETGPITTRIAIFRMRFYLITFATLIGA
jgi:hypothetical protein